MTIHMIYPEVQCVDEHQIAIWYSDAVANDEAEPGCEGDLEAMLLAIQDTGKFTFERIQW